MSQSLLSCFYYMGQGQRCQTTCIWPLFFCATHAVQAQHTPPDDLLAQAAQSLWACTSFTESGLPLLTCRDFEHWCRLANCLTGLSLHGYRDDGEILTALLASLLALDSPWRHKLTNLPPKGRTFEILVARLYLEELGPLIRTSQSETSQTSASFRVLWNQRVKSTVTTGDRQVDVLVRWYKGTASDVFTAVECKDTEVEISDVESFATKIKTIGAHNGVIASSVGFQSGAIDTAKAFGIELRLVREEDLATEPITDFRYVFRFAPQAVFLEPPDGKEQFALPGSPEAYRVLKDGSELGSVDSLVTQIVQTTLPTHRAWPPAIEHSLTGAVLLFPTGETRSLARIYIPLALVQPLEKVTLPRPRHPLIFSVRELLAGPAERRVRTEDVPMLAPPRIEAEHFYTNFFGQCYYCRAVTDDTISFTLLADAQHGHVIDVEGSQSLKEAWHYYAIEDPATITRLEGALERLRRISPTAK